eukprot:1404445-Rhodomonas_salina.1
MRCKHWVRAVLWAVCLAVATLPQACCINASIGIMVPIMWDGYPEPNANGLRYAASAVMAVRHVNERVSTLVPEAATLLPADLSISFDLRDSLTLPRKAISITTEWNEEGKDVII